MHIMYFDTSRPAKVKSTDGLRVVGWKADRKDGRAH